LKILRLDSLLYLYKYSENFHKDKVKKLELLLVFLTILISGSLINLSLPLQIGATFLILFMSTMLLISNSKISKLALRNSLIILFFVLLIFVSKYIFSFTFDSIMKYGYFYINTLIAILILLYFSNKSQVLLKGIYIVLYFIMLHAFFSLLAWYIVRDNLSFVPEIKTYTYNYIFYYAYMDSEVLNMQRTIDIMGIPFFRMSGIFWEPGILQIYMNILLFLSLYIYPNRKISLLSSIVIFSTWSSTGLFILTMQTLVFSFLKMSKTSIFKTIGLIVVFVILLIPLQNNLMNKFQGNEAGSGYARVLDTLTAINIIQKNLLFGIALDSDVYKQELSKNRAIVQMKGLSKERDAHDTNSILNYVVFFGIPFGILILYSLYRQNIFYKNKLIFFMIIFIAFQTEPIGFFIFPLMLIFSSYILKNYNRSFA